MACGKVLYCLKNPCHLLCHGLLKIVGYILTDPWRGLFISLIICFAPRILGLNYWPFLARKLEELGAAVGALGVGLGPVWPGNEAAKEAGQCHSGSAPPFVRSRSKVDLSIFGFAFDPERAGPDAWRGRGLCQLSENQRTQQRVGRCK